MYDKNCFFECLPAENEERKNTKYLTSVLILTINDYIFTVVKEKNADIKVAQR